MNAPGLARITTVGGRMVVTSATKKPGLLLLIANGHVEELADQSASAVGAAIRRAWKASWELPQIDDGDAFDRSFAAEALGYADEESMIAAGAQRAWCDLRKGEVKVTAFRADGDSFQGLPDPVRVPEEGLDDAALGALVLDALAH